MRWFANIVAGRTRNRGQEFVIGGYVPGNPLDSIIVGYYERDKLMYAGKMKNGFVPRTRQEVYQRLKGLEIDNCPFANLPQKKRTPGALTREELKNSVRGEAGGDCANRVCRMDAGRAFKTSKVCGAEG